MTYLGSFPQELCQSDDVGFELSLVGALTSHLQTRVVGGLRDEGPAIPVMRQGIAQVVCSTAQVTAPFGLSHAPIHLGNQSVLRNSINYIFTLFFCPVYVHYVNLMSMRDYVYTAAANSVDFLLRNS